MLGVLGAIASSVGVIGFVVFVGGAVQLARDRGIGISAPFAVPLVPRSQLLASGADQLFAPFIYTLAVVALAAVYLANRHRFLSATGDRLLRRVFLVGGAVAAFILFESYAGEPLPAPLARGDNQTAALGAICVLALGAWTVDRMIAAAAFDAPLSGTRRLVGALGVMAATVIVYGALFVFAHNEWEPQVRPMALIGPSYPAGLSGVYVGEDASRVYLGVLGAPLGNLSSKRLQTRVMEIERSSISAMTVGALFPLANYRPARSSPAYHWALHLTEAQECLREELREAHVLTTRACA